MLLSKRYVTIKIYNHHLVIGSPFSRHTLSRYQINSINISTNTILIQTSLRNFNYHTFNLTNTVEASKLLAETTPGTRILNPLVDLLVNETAATGTPTIVTEPIPDPIQDPRRRMIITGVLFFSRRNSGPPVNTTITRPCQR